jgi:hypothetical protein
MYTAVDKVEVVRLDPFEVKTQDIGFDAFEAPMTCPWVNE